MSWRLKERKFRVQEPCGEQNHNEEVGQRICNISAAHEDFIDLPPGKSADASPNQAYRQIDESGEESDGQRNARSIPNASKQVPSQIISSKPELKKRGADFLAPKM